MTTEEEEKKKFINNLKEFWNVINSEYYQPILLVPVWIFIIAMWTYNALFISDIPSIVGAIFFNSLGIFYIYNDIKKWKAIKLYSIKTN